VFDFAGARICSGRQAARRSSTWAKGYLRRAAAIDLGCATVGVLTAARLWFSNDVTRTHIALGLALSLLWLAALWLAGGFGVRFTRTAPDEFRDVLNAGVSLTSAVAIFSCAINVGAGATQPHGAVELAP
jgi:hypothetical protein